ncbi:MAG: hypothetical protein HC781_06645 [Leptolyngbyaceae cyanobacterium CSU_1_4]|nr:hypothetical protein [Leptolyngbyaceae cyanobacterium CSU_1_4]
MAEKLFPQRNPADHHAAGARSGASLSLHPEHRVLSGAGTGTRHRQPPPAGAAADPAGLTPLNVLKKFPLSNIRIDLDQTLQILGDLETLVRQTQSAIALIQQQSILEASAEPWVPLPNLPDLRSIGSYPWQKRTLRLTDPERASQKRSFLTDIYLPNPPQTFDSARLLAPLRPAADAQPAPSSNAPLIVISHGLGSDRSTYAYLAQQLASYGFAVAVPEHPGSSSQQIQALISGGANEVTTPSEFVDRPLDIHYLLDQLETLSQTDPRFAGRINLKQVGVIGQSLGGYTALALAGAEINQEQLARDCQNSDTLNLSLLLQCRALQLPQFKPTFRDDRVKAIIAINPIGSSLLGKTDLSKINIPVLIISSTADTVAPALLEQILPFTWLQTSDKYLMLLEGGTHFSTIDAPNAASRNNQVELPTELVGPNPRLAYLYVKAIGVAFFKTYVAEDSPYRSFLSAGYVSSISQKSFPTSFVRSLTAAQLAKIFREVPLEPPQRDSMRIPGQASNFGVSTPKSVESIEHSKIPQTAAAGQSLLIPALYGASEPLTGSTKLLPHLTKAKPP